MWKIIIIITVLVGIIIGSAFLLSYGLKKDNAWSLFIIPFFAGFGFLLYFIVTICCKNSNLSYFKKMVTETEYLINTYDIKQDKKGDTIDKIIQNTREINREINIHNKGIHKKIWDCLYIEEIGNTEKIDFDLNKVLKNKDYE